VAPARPDGLNAAAAHALVQTAMRQGRDWLTPEEAFRLLAGYGIPVCPYVVVTDVEDAAAASARLGYPLVAKLATPGAHKSDSGGVRLDIADEARLRAAVGELIAIGDGRVLLQPMIRGGTELIVGSVHDPHCGSLVMIGAGGVLTDILVDRAFGLAPLTDHQADELISDLRAATLLDGYRTALPCGTS
jgi:acetate---CoA ligase (ADP-forming)